MRRRRAANFYESSWLPRQTSCGDQPLSSLALASLQSHGHGMFPCLKKCRNLGKRRRVGRVAEGRQVPGAVDDSDHDVALGKCVSYVSEIGTATSAGLMNEVTIQTAFRVKEFCALEDGAARCANDFFRQRL